MKKIIVLILMAFPLVAQSADTLSLSKAVMIALEQSYSIKIAKNDAAIAELNMSRAAAGMLPSISISAAQSGGVNTINQSLLSGQEIIRNSAGNSATNLGIALNWTLFDGFGMFASYDRLQALKDAGEFQMRSAIEATLRNIVSAYATMVRNQELINAASEKLTVSQEGLRLSTLRFSVGRSGEQEMLQSEVETNADNSALIRLREQYRQSRIQLNTVLGGYKDTTYTVSSTFPLQHIAENTFSEEMVINDNPDLKAVRAGTIAADAMLRQMEARAYPTISLNTEYNFNRSANDGSFLTSSSIRGASFALTAQYTLLDGFRLNNQIESAKIQKNSAALQVEDIKNSLLSAFAIAKGAAKTNTSIVALQENTIALAKKNSSIALEKYKQGTLSNYDFRITQQSIYDAQSSAIQAKYEEVLSKMELLRLTGTLSEILKTH